MSMMKPLEVDSRMRLQPVTPRTVTNRGWFPYWSRPGSKTWRTRRERDDGNINGGVWKDVRKCCNGKMERNALLDHPLLHTC